MDLNTIKEVSIRGDSPCNFRLYTSVKKGEGPLCKECGRFSSLNLKGDSDEHNR